MELNIDWCTVHYVLDLAGTLPLAYVDRNIFGANNFQTLLLESDDEFLLTSS